MSRDPKLKLKWEDLQKDISAKFGGGELLDLDAIIYLIGVQELGQGFRKFSKDDKINVMHIAICKVLSYSGYYELKGLDDNGWPHWELLKPVPHFDLLEQEVAAILNETQKQRWLATADWVRKSFLPLNPEADQ